MPEQLSDNNAREAKAYETEDEAASAELTEYSLRKPFNYPKLVQDAHKKCASMMARLAADLGVSPSILFVFGGGGMEAHLSGLVGDNVVLADISPNLLHLAKHRFDHYGLPQPAAFINCDAERLPFRDESFDFVIGFEGIHHCLVPQAALWEIWRVSRKRTFIVDNFESTLTRLMFKLGKSSVIEYSGVKPNRFTMNAVLTMLHNAKIRNYRFWPHTCLPLAVINRLGMPLSRAFEAGLNRIWQTNMFMLATDKTDSPLMLTGEHKQ